MRLVGLISQATFPMCIATPAQLRAFAVASNLPAGQLRIFLLSTFRALRRFYRFWKKSNVNWKVIFHFLKDSQSMNYLLDGDGYSGSGGGGGDGMVGLWWWWSWWYDGIMVVVFVMVWWDYGGGRDGMVGLWWWWWSSSSSSWWYGGIMMVIVLWWWWWRYDGITVVVVVWWSWWYGGTMVDFQLP